MANEELPPQDEMPSLDIPDLKKKEKERKKSGVAWTSGKPAGNFTGATGGSGAGGAGGGGAGGAVGAGARSAASAASNAARSAATQAFEQAASQAGRGFFGQLAQTVGRFTSTAAGKAMAAAVIAVAVGVVAAILRGGGGNTAGSGPDLGGIASNMRVNRNGDNRALGFAGRSSGGMLKGEEAAIVKPPAEKTAEAPKTETAEETAKVEDEMDKGEGVQGMGDKMAHDMAGSKLSSGLGASFGGKDIFNSDKASTPKFGAGFDRNKLAQFNHGGRGASTKGTRSRRVTNASRNMNLRGNKTNRALGSLRAMAPLNSKIMGGASGETASADAATQFDGQENPNTGTTPTSPVDNVPGGGTGPGGGTNPTGTTPTVNAENPCPDYVKPGDHNGDGVGDEDVTFTGFWNTDTQACDGVPKGGDTLTPWQEKVDEAFDKMDKIKNLFMEIAVLWIVFGIFMLMSLLPFCSGGACGYAGMAVTAIRIFNKCKEVHDLGNDLINLGNDINGMGGKPQGDLFTDTGDKTKWGALIAGTQPVVGALLMAAILEFTVPKREDIIDNLHPENVDMPPPGPGYHWEPTGDPNNPWQAVADPPPPGTEPPPPPPPPDTGPTTI